MRLDLDGATVGLQLDAMSARAWLDSQPGIASAEAVGLDVRDQVAAAILDSREALRLRILALLRSYGAAPPDDFAACARPALIFALPPRSPH